MVTPGSFCAFSGFTMKTPTSLLLTLLFATTVSAQVQYCTVTLSGTSCGPQLAVTMTPLGQGGNHQLDLTATGLHPRSVGALQWGSNPTSVTLPGGGCLLLCDYVWGHYFQTDDFGSYSWGRSWPHWAVGYFYMQMGSLQVDGNNQLSVRTTSCQLVQCF